MAESLSSSPLSEGSAIIPNLKRPKRPLSGYNLFYRYKRVKVLEAVANFDDSNTDTDESAIIRSIITCLPGLEDHTISSSEQEEFSSDDDALNSIRGSIIRDVMKGRIFPNENARFRLHRKVHGMGFVEMGAIMRKMWSNVDEYRKLLFNELADLGRERYRKLLTEYKYNEEKIARSTLLKEVDEASAAVEEHRLQLQSCTSNESTAYHHHPELQVLQVVKPTPLKRTSCSQDDVPQESPFEVTPQVVTKPHVMVPFVTPPDTFTASSRISIQHKQQKQHYHPPLAHRPSPDTTSSGSHCEVPKGRNLFEQMEPLSIVPTTFHHQGSDSNNSCNKRRRVSDNYIMGPFGHGDDTSYTTGMMDSTQYFEEFQASLTGSIPPPPLFKTTGKNGHHSRVSSDSSAVTEAPVPPSIEARESVTISAQDFINLIGKLDEVHQGNEHNDHPLFSAPAPPLSPTMCSMEGVDDDECNSMTMIFGMPIHDVQMTQVEKSPRSARMILSGGGGGGCCLELNDSRARMA